MDASAVRVHAGCHAGARAVLENAWVSGHSTLLVVPLCFTGNRVIVAAGFSVEHALFRLSETPGNRVRSFGDDVPGWGWAQRT